MESALIFSPGQLTLCIAIGLIFAGLVALNIVFAVIYRVKAERKLHSEQLQQKRQALLDKLAYLKAGGEVESTSWLNYVVEDEDEEDVPDKKYVTVRMAVGEQPPNTEIIEVNGMSPRMRRKLGFRAKRYNGKRFYVRYLLGFDARLRFSDDETKARYIDFMEYVKSYVGVSVSKHFGCHKICLGKDVIGMVLFGGKRICIAFALNPSDYENTKYKAEDKSDKRRFAKTPMFVRVGSDDKLNNAKYLFGELARERGLQQISRKKGKYDLTELTREEMIVTGSVRVVIIDEAPNFASTKDNRSEIEKTMSEPNAVAEEKEEFERLESVTSEAAATCINAGLEEVENV